MRCAFAAAAALLCCALLAQAEALRDDVSVTSSTHAGAAVRAGAGTDVDAAGSLAAANLAARRDQRTPWDDLLQAATTRVVDWLRSDIQGSLDSLRTAVENDVTAARNTAQNAVTSSKNNILSSCRSAVDLAAGGITAFNGQIDRMKDDFNQQLNTVTNELGVVRSMLDNFVRSLAAFFTPAFDVKDKPPRCTVPTVFAEVNTFFYNYLSIQPMNSGMWCRFINIASKVRLDAAFQKMFTTQASLFKSTSFLEVDSQTGEAAAVSEEVLLASVNWNVVNVVTETFDGAVDIASLVLAALDEGPVEEAAVEAETGGVDPQLVVSIVAVVFKLTSASLKAAATANGCNNG